MIGVRYGHQGRLRAQIATVIAGPAGGGVARPLSCLGSALPQRPSERSRLHNQPQAKATTSQTAVRWRQPCRREHVRHVLVQRAEFERESVPRENVENGPDRLLGEAWSRGSVS